MEKLDEIFLRTIRNGDCIEWIGAKYPNGYGAIKYEKKHYTTHRLVYMLLNNINNLPYEIQICHHCDNPCCINPDHLFMGTRSDNMKDAYKKGRLNMPKCDGVRFKKGHKPINRKLNDCDVVLIKYKLSLGQGATSISRELDISRNIIEDIKRGHSYADI